MQQKKAYTLKFSKSGYFHSTFGSLSSAEREQKTRGGKVILLNKKQYKKIYGDNNWGYD